MAHPHAPKESVTHGHETRTRTRMGGGESENRYCYDNGEQRHIGVNCPYKWTNSIDEEDDQGSSWESELEGEKAEEIASLVICDDEGEWWWLRRNRITRWGKRIDPRPAFHYLAENDEDERTASPGLTKRWRSFSKRGRKSTL